MEVKSEKKPIDYDRINKLLDRIERLENKVEKLEHGISNKENISDKNFDWENSRQYKIMEKYGVFDKQSELEPLWIKKWKKHEKRL